MTVKIISEFMVEYDLKKEDFLEYTREIKVLVPSFGGTEWHFFHSDNLFNFYHELVMKKIKS